MEQCPSPAFAEDCPRSGRAGSCLGSMLGLLCLARFFSQRCFQIMLQTAVAEAFLVGIHFSTSSCCSKDEIMGRPTYFYLEINLLPSAVNSKAEYKL